MTASADRPAARSLRESAHFLGSPAIIAAVAIIAVMAAAWSWFTPSQLVVQVTQPYALEFRFNYSAELPSDQIVYESGELHFGDPVFLSVVDDIDVMISFDPRTWPITVENAELVGRVVVESSAGWRRTLDTRGPVRATTSSGPATLTIPVSFSQALATAADIGAAAQTQGSLTLKVIADTSIDGTLANGSMTPVRLEPQPELAFDLKPNVASTAPTRRDSPRATFPAEPAAPPTANAATPAASAPSPASAGVRTVNETTQKDVTRPNHIGVGFLSADVATARLVLTLLALALVAATAYNAMVLVRSRRHGEAGYLAARFGRRLVFLTGPPTSPFDEITDVGSFAALVSMSAATQQPVLADVGEFTMTLWVIDGPLRYRYEASLGHIGGAMDPGTMDPGIMHEAAP